MPCLYGFSALRSTDRRLVRARRTGRVASVAVWPSSTTSCPHCKKAFKGELIEGVTPANRGFKCPHCRLFALMDRVEPQSPPPTPLCCLTSSAETLGLGQRLEPLQRVVLDLADPLTPLPECAADLLERAGLVP